MRLFLSALLLSGAIAQPAFAWSEESHMTTGAIAFDDLARSSPEILAEAEKLILAHPHRQQLEAHLAGLSGLERRRALFAWLARWSDDIRKGPYDRPKWHYELRVVSGRVGIWPFRNGRASIGFDENFRTLANRDAPAADRAVALGWLMHIVGDIQQPLHAGHQMTRLFPRTDEAGTLAFVRRVPGGEPTDLHQYWDKHLDVEPDKLKTWQIWAGPLQKSWPRARLPELKLAMSAFRQFDRWTDESNRIAARFAYQGTFLKASADPATAPAVTEHERRASELLAQRRVATGGYRIADTIRMALRANLSARQLKKG